jgi:hypothetical protein
VQNTFLTCDVTIKNEIYAVYFLVKKIGKKIVIIVQSAYLTTPTSKDSGILRQRLAYLRLRYRLKAQPVPECS